MASSTEQEPALWVWPNPPKFCPLTYARGVLKGRPHPKQQRQAPTSSPVARELASVPTPLPCTALIRATRCLQPWLLETQLPGFSGSIRRAFPPAPGCSLAQPSGLQTRATLTWPEHKPLRESQLTLTWMLCRDHIRKTRVDIQQNVLKIYLILSTSHVLKVSKQLKPSTSLKGSCQTRWDKRTPGLCQSHRWLLQAQVLGSFKSGEKKQTSVQNNAFHILSICKTPTKLFS